MFKKLLLFVCFSTSVLAWATSDWCIWDGEEYIQEMMTASGTSWMEVVYNLHVDKDSADLSADFSGVGSCRFMDRTLGDTAQDVITNYIKEGSYIVPTRAYLKINGANTDLVIPYAFYSAGSNWLYVQKDFYSMDRPACEKQMAQMIELGQSADGIRFVDVEYKKNTYGGVTALVNGKSPDANYLGICHFHKVAQ